VEVFEFQFLSLAYIEDIGYWDCAGRVDIVGDAGVVVWGGLAD
jgi:hypothetical protein